MGARRVQAITQRKLEQMLMATNRCQFISLASITDPDMRKRNNPYHGSVRKVTFARGVINWQYERTVRRQQVREGQAESLADADFKAHARQWGSRIKHTPLVSHTAGADGEQRLYLELKREAFTPHYFDRNTGQRLTDIQLAELDKFLREERPGRQPVAKPVVLRDYRLDRIAELTMSGTRYTIAPAATELQTYFPSPDASPATAGSTHSTKRQPAGQGAIV
ncbi:MAG: hypothetical protein Fues2KO_46970 [Fuerstiella sp.]